MTIKELADVAGVSQDTIRRVGKKYFSEMHSKGIKTNYTEKQCEFIMSEVKKKNMVSKLPQTAEVVPQIAEVNYEMIGKMIGMAIATALSPIVDKLDKIGKTNTLQLNAPKEDYFSLVGYTSLNGIKVNRSELAIHGMTLKKLAVEKGLPIKYIPDERWGKVNSYPIELLNEYFSE